MLYSNSGHQMGGIDAKQIYAFAHLFPNGFCDKMFEEDVLFELAALHDWSVEIKPAVMPT